MNDRLLAWVRIGFALLTIAAIVFQASNLVGEGIFNPTRFFLFFTILSNLLAAAVFLEGGRRQLTGAAPVPDLWRGLAVVVMTVPSSSSPSCCRISRSSSRRTWSGSTPSSTA